ncbi:hypothetical protein H4S02_000544 [Coemansia sp. RSA 2611]|nr:hypothetical protein IWW52_000329 [Coemansia sp. RSA 2704]KAJ2329946.1 hypothetical protein IWW51_000275 [Coemansia sp. RSA 2702]KAJ2369679.1 hypothetical protein H4S01_000854 [Coemansia sp. RSA 2610]KAJ2392871.1 hypothetical protein H4S02_000544 [Coemansia sp. RSA 2611]KAJ2739647.1 hypothetical protein H4R23_000313 [Coemansia sp. Cherry 401B]
MREDSKREAQWASEDGAGSASDVEAAEGHEAATDFEAALGHSGAGTSIDANASTRGSGTSMNANASLRGSGTSVHANASSRASAGSSVCGGTLSPPYTLVNSDGASLRVHTGSIRERHMRISAIHEDADADSLGVGSDAARAHHSGRHFDCDDASLLSAFSDGGATTRVRMATDRAYNALRIGPASLLSGHSGAPGLRRAASYAASSDPGLASAASYYDMYFADGFGPRSECAASSSSASSAGRDLISVIRSDVAVCGGGDDKFPFLADNLSEFSGPFACSSVGALDIDRFSRDYERVACAAPGPQPLDAWPEPARLQPPEPPADAKKKKKKKDARLTPRYPRDKRRAGTTPADYAATSPRAVRPPIGSAPSPHPWRQAARRYRRRSAGEPAFEPSAVAAALAAHAPPEPLARPLEPDSPPSIRPNAIMRFLKRIAPRN